MHLEGTYYSNFMVSLLRLLQRLISYRLVLIIPLLYIPFPLVTWQLSTWGSNWL